MFWGWAEMTPANTSTSRVDKSAGEGRRSLLRDRTPPRPRPDTEERLPRAEAGAGARLRGGRLGGQGYRSVAQVG